MFCVNFWVIHKLIYTSIALSNTHTIHLRFNIKTASVRRNDIIVCLYARYTHLVLIPTDSYTHTHTINFFLFSFSVECRHSHNTSDTHTIHTMEQFNHSLTHIPAHTRMHAKEKLRSLLAPHIHIVIV